MVPADSLLMIVQVKRATDGSINVQCPSAIPDPDGLSEAPSKAAIVGSGAGNQSALGAWEYDNHEHAPGRSAVHAYAAHRWCQPFPGLGLIDDEPY
jgi:hypothetical protein